MISPKMIPSYSRRAPRSSSPSLSLPRGRGGAAFGQVEQHSARLARPGLDRQLLPVGAHEFDAFGQRVDLQLDRIGPGTGERHRHEPGLVAGAAADLLTDRLDDPVLDHGLVHHDLGALHGDLLGRGVIGCGQQRRLDRLAGLGRRGTTCEVEQPGSEAGDSEGAQNQEQESSPTSLL